MTRHKRQAAAQNEAGRLPRTMACSLVTGPCHVGERVGNEGRTHGRPRSIRCEPRRPGNLGSKSRARTLACVESLSQSPSGVFSGEDLAGRFPAEVVLSSFLPKDLCPELGNQAVRGPEVRPMEVRIAGPQPATACQHISRTSCGGSRDAVVRRTAGGNCQYRRYLLGNAPISGGRRCSC